MITSSMSDNKAVWRCSTSSPSPFTQCACIDLLTSSSKLGWRVTDCAGPGVNQEGSKNGITYKTEGKMHKGACKEVTTSHLGYSTTSLSYIINVTVHMLVILQYLNRIRCCNYPQY